MERTGASGINNERNGINSEETLGMNELPAGGEAVILSVEARGELRRRLIELGFFPGETVKKVLVSPLGDPSAYLVRESVTAIRGCDASLVRVVPKEVRLWD